MTLLRQSLLHRSLLGLGVALLLGACDGASTAPKPIDELPRTLTVAEDTLIARSNDFAFSLFQELERRTPDANLFMSPLSASMALGMAMNGAAGSTLDAMRTTLGFTDMPLTDVDASYQSLIELLRGLDPTVDFRIANSIWYRQDFPFEQSFLDTGTRYFDATLKGLDFADPAAPTTINAWVKESTNGKIDRIVDRITPADEMFLINAIYFKGTWQHEFDKQRTTNQPFHLADGSTTPVPMMHLENVAVPAAATEEYHAVELPYGGGAYSMVVVVPNEGTSVSDLVATLDESAWQALLASLTDQEGDVYLPRFSLTWDATLNDPLTALGMGIAFQAGNADFTGMSKARGHELYISKVRQKSYVNVDEEGTEAAAVTSVGMKLTSVRVPLLRADRPFLFAIRERLSGTILFMGTMMKPGEQQS
jgi:serpin B